ncbi:MAG TPA: hypothetical protein VFY12_05725 [Arenimonas sp.]|nr:hypothetical protein [Arenimonas sp.]
MHRYRTALIAALALAALASAGCSSRSRGVMPAPDTDVGVALIVPTGAERMQLQANQAFQMAFPVHDPLPDYPVGLIAAGHDEIAVCVDIVITAEGTLDRATSLFAQPQCPLDANSLPEPFVSATLAAVRQWRFVPAEVCRFPEGVEVNRECIGEDVTLHPVPIRMGLVFTFRLVDGRPQVAHRIDATTP